MPSRDELRRSMASHFSSQSSITSLGRAVRALTPEARERAIDFATDAWHSTAGEAMEAGVRHVTGGVLKDLPK